MPKRIRPIRADDIPPGVLKRVTRDATVQAAMARLNPEDPLCCLRVLSVICAAYGLRGEVDEGALSIHLYEPGEDEPKQI